MRVRYTARGGAPVERRIAAMMDETARALSDALAPDDYRAVVLLGGYGRGEGGVEGSNGEERPHNNFDFLVVTPRGVHPERIRERAALALAPLAERFGVGMDSGAISLPSLRRAPCLVMWYDMRFGHRTLLGDAGLLPSMTRFRVDRIVPWDVRNLLVNRGTLLVINEALLASGPGELDADIRRTVVRHAVKAIIGYGDALLFFLGAYHWSYVEKQRRMRARRDVPQAIRELYDEAMELRFRPRYGAFLERDLRAWNRQLREVLEPVHRECEARRLRRPGLTWADYPEVAFGHAASEGLSSARAVLSKLLAASEASPPGELRGRRSRLGWRLSPTRERLPLLFPAVAYDESSSELRALALEALEAPGDSLPQLRNAYLRAWGEHGDPNFPALLRRLHVDLEEPRVMP